MVVGEVVRVEVAEVVGVVTSQSPNPPATKAAVMLLRVSATPLHPSET